jgi:outer membrane protein
MYKSCYIKGRLLLSVLLMIGLMLTTNSAIAQQISGSQYKLSIAEAIQLAKSQNKWVRATALEESATTEDRRDVNKAALPIINANGSYQRFSDLTLFTPENQHPLPLL